MKAIGGINLDSKPVDVKPGQWVNARNKVLHDKLMALSDEHGNTPFGDLPDYQAICGAIPVHDGGFVVFTSSLGHYGAPDDLPGPTPVPVDCEIAFMDKDGNYEPIISDPLLNFDPRHPIDGEIKYNAFGDLIVAFTDDFNPPRLVNLSNLPVELTGAKRLVKASDIDKLRMFPLAKEVSVTFTSVNDNGGSLQTGAYYFFVQLGDTQNSVLTNYMTLFGPVFINDDAQSKGFDYYDGNETGINTTKSISFEISNVDSQFNLVRIGVLRYSNGSVEAKIFSETENQGTIPVVYTGNESYGETIDTVDLLTDNKDYTKIKSITQLFGRLYGANVETREDIGYQPYACNIEIEWLYEDPIILDQIQGSHKDPVLLINRTGFVPGEVYAFYIAFNLTNGAKTFGYHIPGREAMPINALEDGFTGNENDLISDIIDDVANAGNPNLDHLDEDLAIDNRVRFFHTRETARSDGTMGYWENQNEWYPSTDDYPASLQNEKVRHHKMPMLRTLFDQGVIEGATTSEVFHAAMPYDWEYSGDPQDDSWQDLQDILDFWNIKQIDTNFGSFGNSRNTRFNYDSGLGINSTINLEWEVKIAAWQQDTLGITATLRIKKNGTVVHTVSDLGLGKGNFPGFDPEYLASYLSLSGTYSVAVVDGDYIEIEVECDAQDYTFDSNSYWKGNLIGDSGIGQNTSTKALAIRLKNIEIPSDIAEQVQSFEIYYAKRSASNSTWLGQSIGVFGAESIFSDEKGSNAGNFEQTGASSNTIDKSIMRLLPFDMLKNKIALGNNFIRNELVIESEISVLRNINSSSVDDCVLLADYKTTGSISSWNKTDGNDEVRKLINPRYIPAHVTAPGYDNSFCEEAIIGQIENNDLSLSPVSFDPDSVAAIPGHQAYLSNVYQFLLNCYLSYDNQQLIFTGVQYSVDGPGNYSTLKVYGGDCRVGLIGMRMTAPMHNADLGDNNKALKVLHYYPVFASASNINFRHGVDTATGQHYYPAAMEDPVIDAVDWIGRDYTQSNDYSYNSEFSKLNEYNSVTPAPKDSRFGNNFPNWVIRSEPYNSEDRFDAWRIFRQQEYREILPERGEIWAVESMSDKLVIMLETANAVTTGKESLKTTSFDVYLGNGDIFTIDPRESLPTTEGYGGTQSQWAIVKCRYGLFWLDQDHGKVFHFAGKLKELSEDNVSNYFRDELPCKLSLQISENHGDQWIFDSPHLPGGLGCSMGYDDELRRIIITKKDCIIKDEYIANYRGAYDETATYAVDDIVIHNGIPCVREGSGPTTAEQLFVHTQEEGGTLYNRKFIALYESDLVDDASWTFSFSAKGGVWIGWHDYVPNAQFFNRNIHLLSKGYELYKTNQKDTIANYFQIQQQTEIDIPFVFGKGIRGLCSSFSWDSDAVDGVTGRPSWRETFTHAIVYTWRQNSGLVPLTYIEASREREHKWFFNKFRDIQIDPDDPAILEQAFDNTKVNPGKWSLKQRRFIDTYVIIRLINNGVSGKNIYLYNIDVSARQVR